MLWNLLYAMQRFQLCLQKRKKFLRYVFYVLTFVFLTKVVLGSLEDTVIILNLGDVWQHPKFSLFTEFFLNFKT